MIGKSGVITYTIQTDTQQELHDEHLNEILESAYTCARFMSRDYIRNEGNATGSMQVESMPPILNHSEMATS
jgi:hypothetical protein